MSLENRIREIVLNINKLEQICYPDISFKINFLTIFSQSLSDFEDLRKLLSNFGNETKANNGFKYELKSPLKVENEEIELIGIRKPDIHRKELGCADLSYELTDYDKLRKEAFEKGFDIILRKGYEMIELSNFNINVYAYIVKDLD
jgi:hypothetical protein